MLFQQQSWKLFPQRGQLSVTIQNEEKRKMNLPEKPVFGVVAEVGSCCLSRGRVVPLKRLREEAVALEGQEKIGPVLGTSDGGDEKSGEKEERLHCGRFGYDLKVSGSAYTYISG
ncbi:hypothetical protein L596_021205 [Steinernema carpocapsae]|uniref:Uncharacterized protein n=1 Tax=Steinernema carpocapsae TaxID=34508 RepID=A0A4U5MVX3_STECR|nr:hypothetical protein L596_021205 [Steinernema carpocapsae]